MRESGQGADGFAGLPSRRSATLLWSLLALLIGVLASVGLARWQHLHEQRMSREVLERNTERAFNALESKVRTAILVVRAVQSVFAASDEVTPSEFQRIFEILSPGQMLAGLQAVAYSRFEGESASDGPVFRVEMVAPVEGNEALFDLDVRDQPDNVRAVWRSRDGDQPVLSSALPLIQYRGAPEPVMGVVLRLPVFSPGPVPRTLRERRARFVGSLAASFRLDQMLGQVVEASLPSDVGLSIVDVSEAQPQLIFQRFSFGSGQPEQGAQGVQREVDVATRTWRLAATFPEDRWIPSPTVWAFLTLGVLSSMLLATLVAALLCGRERAERMAARVVRQHQETESKFSALNELLPALVMLVGSRDGRVRQANHAARDRLGWSLAELEAGRGPLLSEILSDSSVAERLVSLDPQNGAAQVEQSTTLRGVGGELRVSLSAAAVEVSGEPACLLVANDISPILELNERLRYQASHDALTGLINRFSFEQRFDEMIFGVNAGAQVGALLYIDLDQFKIINDTCGHFAGDQLLAELGSRLKSSIKPGDVLARLGGDEFGILLIDVDAEQAMAVAERARSAIDGFVFSWEQKTFSVSASIGVVMIDQPGVSRRELLANADTACYMAKERGRNRSHLFQDSDRDTVQRKSEMAWAARLRQALAEQRFVLDYQELSYLKPTRNPEGAHFELLVRLIDEDGVEVPPGAFIPAAERFGLMPLIDRWVVDMALSHFGRLHPSGTEAGLCAINLSGATVDDESFAEHVIQLLDRHQIPAHKLCFEITETVAVSNVARVVRFMQRLRLRGVRFSLDDFGSGMASFGYLKSLPVDILKIDGSFIRDIESDPADYSIVRAVTDIGHQLGLVVVAEWVGSARTTELLRGIGVDYAQGFAIHKPERTPLHREGAFSP